MWSPAAPPSSSPLPRRGRHGQGPGRHVGLDAEQLPGPSHLVGPLGEGLAPGGEDPGHLEVPAVPAGVGDNPDAQTSQLGAELGEVHPVAPVSLLTVSTGTPPFPIQTPLYPVYPRSRRENASVPPNVNGTNAFRQPTSDGLTAPRLAMYDQIVASALPHLAPDPFDGEIEVMLRDPEVVAELEELHEQLRRGDLKVGSNDEARGIVGLPPEDQG